MKSASAPTPPDPVATAAAQTKSNKETAGFQQELNMVNQDTPLGKLIYSQTGTSPTGTPQYTATTQLSPVGQKAFDDQQAVSAALNNLALKGTGNVSTAFDTAQNYDSLPKTSNLDLSNLPGLKPFNISGSSPTGLDLSGVSQLPTGIDRSGLPALPNGIDWSQLGKLPETDEAARKKAEDALYGKATSRLDPQFAKARKDLETQMIAKGIQQGSKPWNESLSQFDRSRTDAYDTAQRGSVAGAADYAQSLFNMDKAVYDATFNKATTDFTGKMGARQQGSSEALQDFTGKMGVNQQGMGNAAAKFDAEMAARNQKINEQLSDSNISSQQRSQLLAEQQALSDTALRNRQQGITEANYLRELPINEISALLNGGQVQQPSFTNTPQTQVQGTDVAGIIQNNYDNQYKNYKAKMDANSAMIGAVAGLGGKVLGGWATGGFA